MANDSAMRLKERAKRLMRQSAVRLSYYSRPDFMIVGAQKAGTTFLHWALAEHPLLRPSIEKELHFFNDTRIGYGDFGAYHAMFPLPFQLGPCGRTYETCPAYLYDEKCPKRIYAYKPDLKIIVLVRDPVARAYSAWTMFRRFAKSGDPLRERVGEHRGFEEAIEEELLRLEHTSWETDKWAYVSRGLYADQVDRYYRYFGRDAVRVIENLELSRDPQGTLRAICRWLEVGDEHGFTAKPKNVTRYTSSLGSATAARLRVFYEPHNARLFTLLGREFDWG